MINSVFFSEYNSRFCTFAFKFKTLHKSRELYRTDQVRGHGATRRPASMPLFLVATFYNLSAQCCASIPIATMMIPSLHREL